MRVTVLTSSFPRFQGDGTAPFVQSICEHLAKLGHDIEVVAPFDAAADLSYRQNFPVHRFRYIWPEGLHIMGHARSLESDVRLRPLAYVLLPFFFIAAYWNFLRVTKKQQTELIHVHWVLPNGPVAALAAAWRQVPFVVSLHGSDMYVAQKNELFRRVARWVFRRASAVTVCSPNLQLAATKVGTPHKPTLILWGADPQRFMPQPKNQDWLHKLGIEKNDLIVIALGRLVHKKGFDILLRAWMEIFAEQYEARLVIGGEGPLLQPLKDLAKEVGIADRVIFAERIPWNQVPEFFSIGDLFVLPSAQDEQGNIDGLPTVLLEAMSCGLPVIASEIAGIPEVITHGYNGHLVPPSDAKALANTIANLLQNSATRERLSQAARQSVVESFNWDCVAKTFSQIFDDTLARIPE